MLCVLISSCSRPDTKEWTIPLYNTEANLEILLPNDFTVMKTSIHLSDCKTCGMFRTILTDNDFLNKIDDTTGSFTPWLSDTTTTSIFYIEEQLHPDSSLKNNSRNYEKELNSIVQALKWEDSRTKIHRQDSENNMALISYATFDEDGNITAKRIECRTDFEDRFINIRFIQYHDFQNGLIEKVWSGIKDIQIKKEK